MRIDLRGPRTDPARAWTLLGDTDHLNREAGMGAVRMRLEPARAGAPTVVGEMDGLLGTRMAFVEARSDWVHGRWFRQHRTYARAPVAASRFALTLEVDGDAVIPRLELELEPVSRLLAPAVNARGRTVASRWQAVLDRLPPPGRPAELPPLRQLRPDALAAFERWAAAAPGGIVPAVRAWVLGARESELQRIRPFAVADRCALDRHETLVAMLRAVDAGALELYFSVRCTRCSGEVASGRSLSDLADHADCPSCRIGFAPDLGASVEVLFAPHPAVVPRVGQRFCTLFPSGSPEVRAALGVGPGERLEEVVDLVHGGWRLGAGGEDRDLELQVGDAGADEVNWSRCTAEAHGHGRLPVRAGPVRVAVHNDGTARERVILASHTTTEPMVPASMVAMLPEFRRAFGPAALAPHVRLSARRVALVFTDLSGSTQMYEALGDAAAYSVVRDHFRLLEQAVEAHRGVVVKTIGDAVMASFHTAHDAFEAALAMRAAFDGWIGSLGLAPAPRLNLGVHVGPALAVQTGEGALDWFGRNVNLAARVQGSASGGALLITPEVAADPAVARRLEALERPPEPCVVTLKGIGEVELIQVP
jgi:adenylate cyclase